MPKLVPNTQSGTLTDHQHGTDDALIGLDDRSNLIFGDAFGMDDHARGGNDQVTGGSPVSQIATNTLYGDAFEMHERTRGGNDQLTGGDGPVFNNLFGDAGSMDGHTRGGDDTLTGGANTLSNVLYGDALSMADSARGGNDTLISGSAIVGVEALRLFGDASEMHDKTRGGDDTLTASGPRFSLLVGDGNLMDGDSRGGNDTLMVSLAGASRVFGDASEMHDNARGGNDTVIGGNTQFRNTLVGDAFSMDCHSRGGDDRLVSGTGIDDMWGDAQFINGVQASPSAPTASVVTGADTFVFAPGGGNDIVNDFRLSDHDRIDVSAWGFHSLAEMMITSTGGDTRIAFDANDSVTLVGISDPGTLHASDFIFA